MAANWKGFIDGFAEYLTSKTEKNSQKNADKLIELYLDALSNKATALPGPGLFNKNDPRVLSAKIALKGSFAEAMEMMLKDPEQQKVSFNSKKNDKSFFDPATAESEQALPSEPPIADSISFPPIDPKYYDDIIANSDQTFFIKQKDGARSNKIFDFKTKVDLSAPEGYGIPIAIFGNTLDEIIETLETYTYLPGLLKLLTYKKEKDGVIYDLRPYTLKTKGINTTYGELIRDLVTIYAKKDKYRDIGDSYISVTGGTENQISPSANSELGIIIKLYADSELQSWLVVAKEYMAKTAKDKAIKEIKESQKIPESEKIEGEDDIETQSTGSENPKKDPYEIMAKSLVLFWSVIGTSSNTLFLGLGVPPSVIPTPGLYQVVFPGLPFILAKGFKKAFNVGINPKFIPEITFLQYQINVSSAIKKIDDASKISAKATSAALAAVFGTHLLTLKFLYFGTIPAAPSPIPAPSFVFAVF
jgi:hypothetical protein